MEVIVCMKWSSMKWRSSYVPNEDSTGILETEPYKDSIRKVADQLSKITRGSQVDSVHFDNGFEILTRSNYLIYFYIHELNENPIHVFKEGELETWVLTKMSEQHYFSDDITWVEYLDAFVADPEIQPGLLNELKRTGATSPSSNPTSPSYRPKTDEDEDEATRSPSNTPRSPSNAQKTDEYEDKELKSQGNPEHVHKRPRPLTSNIRLLLAKLALYAHDE